MVLQECTILAPEVAALQSQDYAVGLDATEQVHPICPAQHRRPPHSIEGWRSYELPLPRPGVKEKVTLAANRAALDSEPDCILRRASLTGSHKVGLSMPRTCQSFSDRHRGWSIKDSEWQRGRDEMLCGVVSASVGRLGGTVGMYMCLCWGGVGSLHTGMEKEAKNKLSENSALMAVL